MLTSILLIVPSIHEAILRTRYQRSNLVDLEYLSWLQSEIQNLVSSAAQEVAAESKDSTATPFNSWDYVQIPFDPISIAEAGAPSLGLNILYNFTD